MCVHVRINLTIEQTSRIADLLNLNYTKLLHLSDWEGKKGEIIS